MVARSPHINRRGFVQTAVGGMAAACLASVRPVRASAQSARIAAQSLGGNLFLLTGAGANVVVRTGDGGAVMVDGGAAERSGELLTTVSALPGSGPVHTLFDTHWHPEQTGSNRVLGPSGARIVAHENTRLWLTTDVTRPWDDRTHPPLPEEAQPNDTFYETYGLGAGAERIECGHMPQAHTDGDIYVRFPEENVLVAGGVLSSEDWPLVDWWTGGWINGMVDGLRTLVEACDDDTTIVPADGPVMARAELEAQLAMYGEISQRLRAIMYNGLSPADAVAERLTESHDARLGGDADFFIRRAFESMWGHFTPDA